MVEHTLEVKAGESDVILGFIVNFKASLLWQAVSKYLYMFVYVYLLTHSEFLTSASQTLMKNEVLK